MQTDLGTVGGTIWELRRKVIFRSRTEPFRFMWMRVVESLSFLEWAFSNMVSSEATMEMLQPTREMYSRGVCSSVGTGSPESCMSTAK